MAPNPDLIIEIDPSEVGSETIRTVVLPWSGQSVPVRIPAGMADGALLQLPGIGPAPVPGGPPRDAYLQIRLVPGAVASAPPAPFGVLPPASAPPTTPFGETSASAPPAGPYGAVPPASAPPYGPYGAVPPASAPPYGPASGPPYPGAPSTGQVGAVPPTSAPPYAPYPPVSGAAPNPPFGPYPPLGPTRPAGSGRGKILAIVGGAVAVVLLVALAVPLILWSGDSDRTNTSGNGPAGADASPSVVPVSPPEYQVLLAATDKAVGDAFGKLGGAKNPKAVGTAAGGIESAIEQQITALSAVVPPQSVTAAHNDLLSGLEGLADALAETGSAAGAGEVCLGSSALARISRESAAEELRAAQQALATVDPAQPYQVGAFVPKVTKDANRRLGNGSFIKRNRSGLGELKIENGGSSDAVINVVRNGSKSASISVYVRAKGNFTVRGVRDGTYRVFMTGGKDWDGRAKAFSRSCSFERFEDTFKFSTSSSSYTIWTITLTPTVGGNARTSDVDPGDFPG